MTAQLRLILVLGFSVGVQSTLSAQQQEIRVAAAADLNFAMTDLAAQYKKQSGAAVSVTYGSSGNFFSQIQNGAPFDLLFSADIEYPRKLEAAGLTKPGTLYEYAVGRIAIWLPPDANLNVNKEQWKSLLDTSVHKIAIANPEHAPYGRAAVAALKNAGIYEQVQAKLVYGENISQASQFVQSGNAQAGIIALSLALSPPMRSGKCWQIPPSMHPPIEQAAVMLKAAKNKEAARAFLEFVKNETGRQILAKYGFTVPSSKQRAAVTK